MNARAQDVVLATDSLTQKQEDFARYYVECRNATTAYRLAYNVGRDTLPTTLWSEASRTLAHPMVAARVQELQEAAAGLTLVKARDIVQDWVDQADTDANELVQLRTVNCRHCWGASQRYQWRDEDELLDAVLLKQEEVDRGVKHVKMPDVRGGFGFDPKKPPNPDCVKCLGAGNVVVKFTDTDKLSPRARKLYKGAKVTATGTELLLHDANASRVEVAKALGIYGKDVTLNPAAAQKPAATGATEAEAALAYQRMIGQA
jgi:phage terminase small subunit